MDREALRREALAQMETALDKIVDDASGSLQDMAAMERRIYDAMNGVKSKVLQAWVDQAKDDSSRPNCPQCGQPLRQKQRVDKTCGCEGGQVTVPRTRWWCDACKASFFPSGQHGDGGVSGDHA